MCLWWTLWLAIAVLPLLAPGEESLPSSDAAQSVDSAHEKLRSVEQRLSQAHAEAHAASQQDPKKAAVAAGLNEVLGGLRESFAGLVAELKAEVAASEQSAPVATETPQEKEPPALTHDQAKALHKMMDGNNDGKLSLTEMMEFSHTVRKAIAKKEASEGLQDLDTNKDGKIDMAEIIQMLAAAGEESEDELHAKKFKIADENGDGVLDHGELPSFLYPEAHDDVFKQYADAVFQKKDLNRDGALSHDEHWHAAEEEHVRLEQHSDFGHLDKDKSGKLDLHEMMHWESGAFRVRKLFDVADADRDAYITISEFQEACDTMAGSPAENLLVEWIEHHEL